MSRMSFIAIAICLAAVGYAPAGWAGELGKAVIERLGQIVPSPAPSPEPEERIRLITSLTVQNKPDGASIVTFEAADYGEGENEKFRVIAIEQYSLVEPKPQARALRDEIVRKLRDLERDLLQYVEITGPPREPQKVHELGGAGAGGMQPYR